jgi:hypothetical protein
LKYREAAIHMSKFRLRCSECGKKFCAKCLTEPYHLGKTCEEYKEFKEAMRCRYCNDKIVQPSVSDEPAFINVC